jgi:type IV secretory pathway VirJ component
VRTAPGGALRAALCALAAWCILVMPPRAACAPDGAAVAGLPLVEVPAAPGTDGDTFAVFVSGDGGWAALDREVAAGLAAAGVPVAGLNALRYFWTPRTPEGAAADLARIVRHYAVRWGRKRVILAGYSRGAGVLPFIAARLPKDLKPEVALIALLGPERRASFTFHLADWLGPLAPEGDRPVAAVVEALWDVPVLCVYGTEERDSACTRIAPGRARRVALAGAHHFGGDYAALAREILASIDGHRLSQ